MAIMVIKKYLILMTAISLMMLLLTTSLEKFTATSPQSVGDAVQVLCWVVTAPKYHATRSRAVKETWVRHCDEHLFVSTRPDLKLDPLVVNVAENYFTLWGKTRAALRHLYYNYLNTHHWFIKTDDDTFVIMENLKHMLQLYNHQDPIYFGNKFQTKEIRQGFMGGGAGYVLSREALRRVVEEGFPNKEACSQGPKGREDVELGRCLEAAGVVAGDSRDHLGRDRFMTFTPDVLQVNGSINKKGNSWFWDLVYYPTKEGPMCCSDTAITFHYVSPEMMRALYYLIYVFRMASPRDPPPLYPPSLNSSNSSTHN